MSCMTHMSACVMVLLLTAAHAAAATTKPPPGLALLGDLVLCPCCWSDRRGLSSNLAELVMGGGGYCYT
jgi:hypothetical protein